MPRKSFLHANEDDHTGFVGGDEPGLLESQPRARYTKYYVTPLASRLFESADVFVTRKTMRTDHSLQGQWNEIGRSLCLLNLVRFFKGKKLHYSHPVTIITLHLL
jgi:hypothetical protein